MQSSRRPAVTPACRSADRPGGMRNRPETGRHPRAWRPAPSAIARAGTGESPGLGGKRGRPVGSGAMDFALPAELEELRAEAREVGLAAAERVEVPDDSWIVGHDRA